MSLTNAGPATPQSSLDSVVSIPEGLELEKWRKLSDNHSLAQLHTQFWGKSMVEEEAGCNKQESTSTPTGSDNNQRSSDDTIETKGDEYDKHDDIIPGCHVLDLDGKDYWIQRMWVRVSVSTKCMMTVFTNLVGRIHTNL